MLEQAEYSSPNLGFPSSTGDILGPRVSVMKMVHWSLAWGFPGGSAVKNLPAIHRV